jgi:hypothetical protein
MEDKMPCSCTFVSEYGRSPYCLLRELSSRPSQGVLLRTGSAHILYLLS